MKIFRIGDLTVCLFFLMVPVGKLRLVPTIVSCCSRFLCLCEPQNLEELQAVGGRSCISTVYTSLEVDIWKAPACKQCTGNATVRHKNTTVFVVTAAHVAAWENSATSCWGILGGGRASGEWCLYWLLLAWNHWPFSIFPLWSPESDRAKSPASKDSHADIQAVPRRHRPGSRWTSRVQGGPGPLALPQQVAVMVKSH